MRLVIARCSVDYTGRLSAHLPDATRLIMVKADGCVAIHADGGAYKPLNWMNAPNKLREVLEADPVQWIVTNPKGETLTITLHDILSDTRHDLGEDPGLTKDGVEAHLQELLAEQPHWCGEGLRLVRREWATDIGPVDLMCRDPEDGWVAVEIKRVGTIEAVEQITRYLERIHREPAMAECRGVLAAQSIKPQARTLAEGREIACVEVDLAVLRGERKPDLTLFT